MTNAKITRTTSGLREALFDQMDSLRDGKTTPHVSASMAKLAVQIINSVRLEIEYQRHIASTPATGQVLSISAISLGK